MTAGRTDTAAGSSTAASPRPPVLTTPDLSRLRDGAADELAAGEMVEDLRLAEADLSGAGLSAISLLSCRFSEVFADDTDLTAARLVDCRLERLSSTYLHSPRSTWRTVELIDSANLAGPALRDILIRGTRIDELDLSGIEAERVRFEDCRVGTLRLRGGSLSDVDLRGLEMRVVSGVGSLAGATISGEQLTGLAPLLAQHLGLRVEDQDDGQNPITGSKGVAEHDATDIR